MCALLGLATAIASGEVIVAGRTRRELICVKDRASSTALWDRSRPLAARLAILEEPSSTGGTCREVDSDADKERYGRYFWSDEHPKRSNCTGWAFTEPGGIAWAAAAIAAAAVGKQQRHGHARKDAADHSERVVATALGPWRGYSHRP